MKLIALDIGGTSIKSAVLEDEVMTRYRECPTEAFRGGSHVVRQAIQVIQSLGKADGIGISTAGQVDAEHGVIRYANENIPGYTGTELKKIVETEFGIPTIIENDVNAAAVGEGKFGAAKGESDFLCLTYGTGVGGALVFNGKVYRGGTGSAGEFGSMIVHGGQVIPGKRISGCYEAYASATALIRTVKTMFPEATDGYWVFEHIEEPMVKKAVDDWIEEIVHGLVTLIHIFNPNCIVLGGGVMNQLYVAEKVRKLTESRIMPSFRKVRIIPACLGNKAGLWGAAFLAEELVRHG